MLCFSLKTTFALIVGGHKHTDVNKFNFLQGVLPKNSYIYNYVRGPQEKHKKQLLGGPTLKLWCDIVLKDVYIQENRGRDAAAFYHFVSTNYDVLPQHIVFLHGHLGNARHTSNIVITTRLRYYIQTLPNALITFTTGPQKSPSNGLEEGVV